MFIITGGSPFPTSKRSTDVSAFSSKFDAFLEGNYTMTADEMAGYKLFDGKGNCNSCHLDGRSTLCVDRNIALPPVAALTDTGTTAHVTPAVHLLRLCQ